MSSSNKIGQNISSRLGIVYLFIVLFALLIVGNVVYLQVAEHDKWANSNLLSQREKIIEASRGDICAADGRILATSVPYYDVRMDLKSPAITDAIFNKHIDSLSYCLSKLFGDKSENQYRRKLISARYHGERYHLIKRRVNFIQLKKLKTFPILRRGKFKGGLIVIQENRRIQPFVTLGSRTIGYLGKGGTSVGLEGAFDKMLKGENGVRVEQRIAGNYWMSVSDESEVEPHNGYDIITAIDINLQDVAHHALKTQLQHHKASHGTAILMEVKTGDIKAIVNLKRGESGQYSERYNYAIGERTEPGSTFKLSSLMVALEDGFIDLTDSIDTGNGVIRYHNFPVTDSHRGGLGKITVQQVFELSSNVGVSKIITQYYTGKEDRFVNRLKGMGLTKKLGLAIKGERAPYIKFPKDTLWSGISLPQMAYGYEVEQTPMQILTFYNAVANDGEMLKPRFVKAIVDHGQTIKTVPIKVMNPSICSKSTIRKAKKMLEGVVLRGTAQNLKTTNYKIAGKTGTAQIANTKYGYKSKVSYQASFVGYFPADNPKYTCMVVVNAPSAGVYYGNLVAGQVFKEIADKVYSTSLDLHVAMPDSCKPKFVDTPYSKKGYRKDLESVLSDLNVSYHNLGINSDWVETQKNDTVIEFFNRYVKDKKVPNVMGMGAKDAIFILENIGLSVILKGCGAVKQQSILPESKFNVGDRIILKLT